MSLFGSSLEGFYSISFSCSGVLLCSEVSNAAVFLLECSVFFSRNDS